MTRVVTEQLWKTYSRVQADPLLYMDRKRPSPGRAKRGLEMMEHGAQLFLSTVNMYNYLEQNWIKHRNHIITIVVPFLRDFYHLNIDFFYPDGLAEFSDTIYTQDPDNRGVNFYNVYYYPEVGSQGQLRNISEYQLDGVITKYDIVQLPARDFIDTINLNSPLNFTLLFDKWPVILSLTYEESDLWDYETQSIRRFKSTRNY